MRHITCYGNGYMVDSGGNIYNPKGMKMSPKVDSKGKYLIISLSSAGKKKYFLVHRLVALAYIENPQNKPQVNHKDGDTQNNKLNNLEWVTASENQKHAVEVLGRKIKPCMLGKKGASHNRSKSITLIYPNGEIHTFGSGGEILEVMGFEPSCFSYARRKGLPYTFSKGDAKGYTMIEVIE